ncbi:hypothetical protein GCM10008094_20170 [Aidingimonas halophila]|nr:hypothetical protein GCM10008094_20170 [Aidingimonas halophila]
MSLGLQRLGLFLHRVELADLVYGPVGLTGLALGLHLPGLDELATSMRPAAGMGEAVTAHDLGIAFIAIGDQTAVTDQSDEDAA